MNWMETVGGLLQQYTDQNATTADAETHFDQVTNAAPSSALGGAVADMFRSGDTPPFAQLAGQLFGNANGAQKASVLANWFQPPDPLFLPSSAALDLARSLRSSPQVEPLRLKPPRRSLPK